LTGANSKGIETGRLERGSGSLLSLLVFDKAVREAFWSNCVRCIAALATDKAVLLPQRLSTPRKGPVLSPGAHRHRSYRSYTTYSATSSGHGAVNTAPPVTVWRKLQATRTALPKTQQDQLSAKKPIRSRSNPFPMARHHENAPSQGLNPQLSTTLMIEHKVPSAHQAPEQILDGLPLVFRCFGAREHLRHRRFLRVARQA
jgi:hypothetical protein